MSDAVTATVTVGLLGTSWPAILMSPTAEVCVLGTAIVLALTGLYLQLHLVEHQMTMEELIKERKLTEEQVRRRVLVYRIGGPATIVVAAILFGLVFIG